MAGLERSNQEWTERKQAFFGQCCNLGSPSVGGGGGLAVPNTAPDVAALGPISNPSPRGGIVASRPSSNSSPGGRIVVPTAAASRQGSVPKPPSLIPTPARSGPGDPGSRSPSEGLLQSEMTCLTAAFFGVRYPATCLGWAYGNVSSKAVVFMPLPSTRLMGFVFCRSFISCVIHK